MRNFDAIAALRGHELRPELRAQLDRAAIEPRSNCSSEARRCCSPVRTQLPRWTRDNVVPLKTRVA
jgi:hypothetical protein